MRKPTFKTALVMLSLIILAAPLAGCTGGPGGSADDAAPFYDDRVSTVRIVMSGEAWDYCVQNTAEEEYVKADFWFGDELVPDVAIRPKGNSSLKSVVSSGSIRMSLKVDFNFFNSARTFHGLKKINLNNGFSDPTLIRETLGYEIFEQMGLPTPRTTFVDVWVNDIHLGVYTMVEQIDKTFLSNQFEDANGNLYKPEMPAAKLDWTEADLAEQPEQALSDDPLDVNLGGGKLSEIMDLMEPADTEEATLVNPRARIPAMIDIPGDKPVIGQEPQANNREENVLFARGTVKRSGNYLDLMALKTNENTADHSALLQMLEVLNNEPDETFPAEIEKVLDVDQVLRFLAVSAAIVHLDNYIGQGHNYYLYESGGKFTVIPWDLNMAFGTFSLGLDLEGLINYYIDEPTCGNVANYPLAGRLLAVPAYLETYHGYLAELIEGPFSEEAVAARIDELANLIRPYVAQDDLKFFTTGQFETGLYGNADFESSRRNSRMMAYPLKYFVTERIESIRAQLAGEREAASADGSGNSRELTSLP